MTKEVSATELRQKFGELLDGVYYKGNRLIVKRANKPMAAIIPIEAFEQLQKRRKAAFDRLERAWAEMPDVPEEEVEADIERAIAEVRVEKRRKASERAS